MPALLLNATVFAVPVDVDKLTRILFLKMSFAFVDVVLAVWNKVEVTKFVPEETAFKYTVLWARFKVAKAEVDDI